MNMNRWSLLVGICLCLLLSVHTANACDAIYNGQNFGLNTQITANSDGDTYYLNPCAGVDCGVKRLKSVCQMHSGTYYGLGTTSTGTFSVPDSKTILYTTSDPSEPVCSPSNLPRTSKIYFDCNPTAPSPPTSMTVTAPAGGGTGPDACTWTFRIPSKEACIAAAAGPSDDSGGSSKLSGGWIFVIIFIVVTFVYFVGGAAYMRFKNGATGLDMCPNREFWKDLFPLVKDGFVYSFGKCRGLCAGGGSTSSYSNI